jgi:hypothetical protein
MKRALEIIVFAGLIATAGSQAQDPGTTAAMQAAQQATNAAIQANQQVMQAAQQANDDAMRANLRAMDDAMRNAQNNTLALAMTAPPKFSADSGRIGAGDRVRITSSTHYAVIYYTTDGWTPTTASTRYTGPIEIDRDTSIQAIAIAPDLTRNLVSRAEYKVIGQQPQPAAPPAPVSTDGVLRGGTPLLLTTAGTADSKTAQVGDKLMLRLEQDVMLGDRVVIPKGTAIEATLTHADHAGHVGVPGDLAFEVHDLVADGLRIPLSGGATLEGPDHYRKTIGLAMIPVVGVAALTVHGSEAAIQPGMPVTVSVKDDTPLSPTASR